MPIRIGQRCCARSIELRHLIRSQIPAYRAEIVSKLLFIPGADDNRRTVGRWSSQFNAIWGAVFPVSFAI